MRLEIEQYNYIKKLVIETFKEYDVKCIPISAFELAIKMGIKVIPYSSLTPTQKEKAIRFSSDGFSWDKKNDNYTIYYNDEGNNYERINRTIMHEIGHYSLGHNESGAIEEAEANFFAKYALAPPPLVNLLPNVTIRTIRVAFGISKKAAYYAYQSYKNWLNNGMDEYTDYEIQLLTLFEAA